MLKSLRKVVLPDVYKAVYQKPISEKEIHSELIRNKRKTLIIVEDDPNYDFTISMASDVLIFDGDVEYEHSRLQRCYPKTSNDQLIVVANGNNESTLSLRSNSSVDLFSNYCIRNRRFLCMNFDADYALDFLIDEYNSQFPNLLKSAHFLGRFGFEAKASNSDLNSKLEYSDIKIICLAEQIASLYGGESIRQYSSKEQYNLTCPKTKKRLTSNYEKARAIIKREVINLVGPKGSALK